jgi:hypothetical protein
MSEVKEDTNIDFSTKRKVFKSLILQLAKSYRSKCRQYRTHKLICLMQFIPNITPTDSMKKISSAIESDIQRLDAKYSELIKNISVECDESNVDFEKIINDIMAGKIDSTHNKEFKSAEARLETIKAEISGKQFHLKALTEDIITKKVNLRSLETEYKNIDMEIKKSKLYYEELSKKTLSLSSLIIEQNKSIGKYKTQIVDLDIFYSKQLIESEKILKERNDLVTTINTLRHNFSEVLDESKELDLNQLIKQENQRFKKAEKHCHDIPKLNIVINEKEKSMIENTYSKLNNSIISDQVIKINGEYINIDSFIKYTGVVFQMLISNRINDAITLVKQLLDSSALVYSKMIMNLVLEYFHTYD